MNPSTNGRDTRGKFTVGNGGGPGNPYAGRVQELRALFYQCVTDTDMREVVAALVKEAKSGNVHAIKEYLERALGKAESADLTARIEELETLLREIAAGQSAPREMRAMA